MKKFIKVVAIIATVMLTSVFIACSNPSSSNGNSSNETTETSADPFAGTTWKCQYGDDTIVFSSTENKVVVTYLGDDYKGDYTVVDSYNAMIKIGLRSHQFEIDRNNTKICCFFLGYEYIY